MCNVIKKIFFAVVILLLFVAFGVIAFIVNAKIIYKNFYNDAIQEFQIPEINSGFVPQGLEYCEEENLFLISGYMNGDGASRIYVVNSDGSYRKISILNADDGEFINHSGGICVSEKYIYIAGCDGKCYVLDREQVMDSGSESVEVIGSFDVYNNSAFCYINNGLLYVGEYYHSLTYPTNKSHHFNTPSGDENKAIINVYRLDDSYPLGVNTIPESVYSITGRIQGMCISENNELVLSASGGFTSSELYCYDYSSITDREHGSISINGINVPLYYIDTVNLIKTITIPPKSEGIVNYDGKIYILFESASNKFVLGKFIGGKNVYIWNVLNH